MSAGKTERPGLNDSLFSKGRRISRVNDNILRHLKVKGGKLRRVRDKWTIEMGSGGSGSGGSGSDSGSGGSGEPAPAAATNPFWALEIDEDGIATCSKCWLWVTGTTITKASLTCGLLRQSGYIQAAYTGGNNQLALEYTTSLKVNDPPKIYLPLYQITYNSSGWEVYSDLRHMPKIGVYL